MYNEQTLNILRSLRDHFILGFRKPGISSCVLPSAVPGQCPGAREEIRRIFWKPIPMNASSSTPALATRPDDEVTIGRADLVADTTFATEEIDEAIDVVFAAIKGAQRSLNSIPDNASPIEVRNEWRLHNLLVRQAIRLIDERVQELAKATRRLARAS